MSVSRFLLDTHALIWWWTDDPRLSARAHAVIADRSNGVWVSAASVWEMRTKARLGRLPGVPGLVDAYDNLMRRGSLHTLDISWRHAYVAASFDVDHQDPFDRMLVAQAELEGMTLITADTAMAQFEVARFW